MSRLWGVIRKILNKGVGYLLGCNIRFWFDVWVGKASLCVLYSKVFRVASNEEFSVKDCLCG